MTSHASTRIVHAHETDRLDRAMACLRSTGERTKVPWLRSLCQRKWWEAASIQKARSCGHHVSLMTTRDWRVF